MQQLLQTQPATVAPASTEDALENALIPAEDQDVLTDVLREQINEAIENQNTTPEQPTINVSGPGAEGASIEILPIDGAAGTGASQ